jgi:tetratricopeptide (TPR) repeat protein
VGDGSLAVTWAPRFTEHLGPLADHGYELTLLAWRRPVPDDSARAILARFGVLDSLGGLRLLAYPGGGPLDRALAALARAYGDRAAVAVDWAEVGRRLETDPRDLFVILLHEIAYGVFERLADAGRLDVPRVLTDGSPRSDGASLVSLVTGRPPRPSDEAMVAYRRNGWHGSPEVVRRLRLALGVEPGDVRTRWTLALSLYDVGRYTEAVTEFRRVTAAARRDTAFRNLGDWSRLWIGHCYDALGQRSRALAIYRDVARTGDPSGQMMMGQYRIGPITSRAWAEQRLQSPFHAPD